MSKKRDPEQVVRILTHIGEPAEPPALTMWPEIDQTCGQDTRE